LAFGEGGCQFYWFIASNHHKLQIINDTVVATSQMNNLVKTKKTNNTWNMLF